MPSWISQGVLKGATGATGSTGAPGTTLWSGLTGTPPALSTFSGNLPESAVTNLPTDLAAKAPTSRLITAGTGLSGGGDLSADRTLAVDSTVLRSTQLDGYSVALGAYTANVLSAPRPIYNVIEIFDEFTFYNAGYTASGSMASANGWFASISNGVISSTANAAGTDSFNQCVGIWLLGTNNVASAFVRMYLPSSFTLLGLGQLDLFFRIAFFAIPTASTSPTFRVGVSDVIGTYTNSVQLLMSWQSSAAKWNGFTNKAGTSTLSAGATTPAISALSASALTFYKCQISINAAASSISYIVNGVTVATVTTNIPNTATTMVPFVAIDGGSAAVGNNLYVDKVYYRYQIAQV